MTQQARNEEREGGEASGQLELILVRSVWISSLLFRLVPVQDMSRRRGTHSELVRRESENLEPLAVVLLVDLLHGRGHRVRT